MKKISFISLIAVMSLPAFGVTDVHKMYGKEPVDPKVVAQYEQQFGKAQEKDLAETKDAVKAEGAKQDAVADKADEADKAEDVKKADAEKEIKEEQKEVKEEVKEKPKKEVQEKTEKTEEVKEYKDNKKEEYSAPSNPKARFPHGLQLGVGISPTSGLNGFVGYNNKNFDSFWAKRFGIRFDFASYSPIKSKVNKEINKVAADEGGIEIDDTLKIDNLTLNAKHYGAMIDFYPFGNTWFLGGLRVSGGYFVGRLDFDANIYGTPDNSGNIEFELNNNKYYYVGSMNAKVSANWKYSGPYAGAGFDLGLFWGFKIYFDAGVVFTGNTANFDLNVPTDNLYYAGGTAVAGNESQFNADRDKELADARKEIKDYPYYPLMKLGFMYRF